MKIPGLPYQLTGLWSPGSAAGHVYSKQTNKQKSWKWLVTVAFPLWHYVLIGLSLNIHSSLEVCSIKSISPQPITMYRHFPVISLAILYTSLELPLNDCFNTLRPRVIASFAPPRGLLGSLGERPFIHSPTPSFGKGLLNIYYMPGIALATRNMAVDKMGKIFDHVELTLYWDRE